MNYRIIGNDGKTYGPISAEKVREWIAQGRLDSRTAVILDGANEWTFLGLLPEFAQELPPPPVMAPPKIAPPPLAKNKNGFATAGFVCGLLSLICCCGCPFNILGLIFSITALVQINGQTQKEDGWGLALAGLICSSASLLFSFGLVLFHSLSTPANFSWHFNGV